MTIKIKHFECDLTSVCFQKEGRIPTARRADAMCDATYVSSFRLCGILEPDVLKDLVKGMSPFETFIGFVSDESSCV